MHATPAAEPLAPDTAHHLAVDPDDGPRKSWVVLALTLAAQILVVLDISVVNTALPSIGRDLGLDGSDLAVGRHRLPDDVRRRAAVRRPHRRPALAQVGVPDRPGRVHRWRPSSAASPAAPPS